MWGERRSDEKGQGVPKKWSLKVSPAEIGPRGRNTARPTCLGTPKDALGPSGREVGIVP